MTFNFSETAGAAQNTSRQPLAANAIHEVTFDGCEIKDVVGVKDTSATYKLLEIKFTNEDGYFTHSIFEPKDADFQDRPTQYGDNPSNVKSMMLLFKHLIDAVNPELGAKIDAKEKEITAKSWDGLRQLMVEATKIGIGKKTKIKLSRSNKGVAIFPYFAAYNKEKVLYMKTNFIGDKLFFTPKEQEAINKVATAKPSTPDADFSFDAPAPVVEENVGALADFNL